jgi:hypothetical protein
MPDGAAPIWPLTAFAPLLAGISHSQAISTHRAAQAMRAPRAPISPPGRSFGQTINPIMPYRRTAPGAPVRGPAALANSIPNASPNHQTMNTHTNEPASASLTVGRTSSPSPIATWVRAKRVFQKPWWPPASRAPQPTLEESQCGWPDSMPVSIEVKPLPYMNDWNCNAPSSSQISPRTDCTERRPSEKR